MDAWIRSRFVLRGWIRIRSISGSETLRERQDWLMYRSFSGDYNYYPDRDEEIDSRLLDQNIEGYTTKVMNIYKQLS